MHLRGHILSKKIALPTQKYAFSYSLSVCKDEAQMTGREQNKFKWNEISKSGQRQFRELMEQLRKNNIQTKLRHKRRMNIMMFPKKSGTNRVVRFFPRKDFLFNYYFCIFFSPQSACVLLLVFDFIEPYFVLSHSYKLLICVCMYIVHCASNTLSYFMCHNGIS